MSELLNQYLGEDCVIYTMNTQLSGVVKEIKDGWMLLETPSGNELVNTDYIVRVRKYPVNKNGKRKSLIMD